MYSFFDFCCSKEDDASPVIQSQVRGIGEEEAELPLPVRPAQPPAHKAGGVSPREPLAATAEPRIVEASLLTRKSAGETTAPAARGNPAAGSLVGFPTGIAVIAARDISINGVLVASQGDPGVVQGPWQHEGETRVLVKWQNRRDGKRASVTVLASQIIPDGKAPAALIAEAHPEEQQQEIEYNVTIRKVPGNMKIGICWDGQEFVVNDATRTMIKAWNAANPGTVVLAGDSLVEVNGIRHSAAQMLLEILNQRVLELTLRKEACASVAQSDEGSDLDTNLVQWAGGVCRSMPATPDT